MIIIYCNFKGFHEKLDYLTFVSRRSFFVKNNFVSLSLSQFADKVCKLKPQKDFCGWYLLFCDQLFERNDLHSEAKYTCCGIDLVERCE